MHSIITDGQMVDMTPVSNCTANIKPNSVKSPKISLIYLSKNTKLKHWILTICRSRGDSLCTSVWQPALDEQHDTDSCHSAVDSLHYCISMTLYPLSTPTICSFMHSPTGIAARGGAVAPEFGKAFSQAIATFFMQQPTAEKCSIFIIWKMEFIPARKMKRPKSVFKQIIGWGESGKEILNETLLSIM